MTPRRRPQRRPPRGPRRRSVAIFPGTFDPITLGHVDLIRRGAALFDELIVAVGDNPDKACLLPAERRAEIVRQVVGGLEGVRVERYTGLTIGFARRVGAGILLRGLRDGEDLAFEAPLAQTNRQVSGVETLFLLPSPSVAFISSRLVRQLIAGRADVSSLVPAEVLPHLPGGSLSSQVLGVGARAEKRRCQGRGA